MCTGWFQGREGAAGGQGGGRWVVRPGSVEATASQVFGDDDVRHGVKDKLDVVGVSNIYRNME